ncbi:MAG: erythromycin esterase family protein [Steroidobacteraceae bacterium]
MHGAEEPLAFRNCLFRYLVEYRGFTAIALESGLNESRALHDFVLAGEATEANDVARDGYTWGFGRYARNVALLDWIRHHNAGLPSTQRVHVYGIDLSGGDAEGNWSGARATLDDSLGFLSRVAARATGHLRRRLEPFLGQFTVPGYLAMPAGARRELRSALDELVRYYDRHRASLVAVSSERDFSWARQNAIAARQLESLFQVSRLPGGGAVLAPDDYKADAVRDAAMAANVRWVMEREGPNGRILLFAHDGHVMNARTRGGIWSVYARAPPAMGLHLRSALGRDLSIVAISGSMSGPGRRSTSRVSATLDAALARVGPERFLLDFRSAGQPASAAAWLERTQSLRTNSATEILVFPARAFDAIVFFRDLTPAVRVLLD